MHDGSFSLWMMRPDFFCMGRVTSYDITGMSVTVPGHSDTLLKLGTFASFKIFFHVWKFGVLLGLRFQPLCK